MPSRYHSTSSFSLAQTPATKLIVASTILSYFIQLYFAWGLHSSAYDQAFIFSQFTLENHAYWQWWTYAWIHSETLPIHLLVNMLMVWVLGCELERALGSFRFCLLYFVAAPASAAAYLLWNGTTHDSIGGASGCAFALLTALAVLYPNRMLSVLLFFVIPLRLKLKTLAWIACGLELIMLLMHWLPSIAHSAHLGGALTGVLLGWLFRPRSSSTPQFFS